MTELLDADFARAGFDIEEVRVDDAARPPRITVVADGENGLDLDSIAQLSRMASDILDALDTPAYVLEVTSPGVERPLTTEAHFRRSRGRRVTMTLADGSRLTGRLGQTQGGAVGLVVREGRGRLAVRDIGLDEIAKAVVEVEFSPPNPHELEMSGQFGKEA